MPMTSILNSICNKFENILASNNNSPFQNQSELSSCDKNNNDHGDEEKTKKSTLSGNPLFILKRRHAIKHKYTILEHQFQSLLLTSPTYCSQCNECIMGLLAQSCSSCHLISHQQCLNKVSLTCYYSNSTSENNETNNHIILKNNHKLNSKIFIKPTFCCHCGTLITYVGKQGLSCDVCQLNVHYKCKDFISTRHCQHHHQHDNSDSINNKTTNLINNNNIFTQTSTKLINNNNNNNNNNNRNENNILSQEDTESLFPSSANGGGCTSDFIEWSKVLFEDFQPIRLLGRGSSSKVLLVELSSSSSSTLSNRNKTSITTTKTKNNFSSPGELSTYSSPPLTKQWTTINEQQQSTSSSIIDVRDNGGGANNRGLFAIKIIKKTDLFRVCDSESIMTEMKILNLGRSHMFLAALHCCFQTIDRLYFVMDFVDGKDLFYHIFEQNNQQGTKFGENRTRFYAAEIFLAVDYLHRKRIIHRDLKLENVILEKSGHCKLVDFGLSKELTNQQLNNNIYPNQTTETLQQKQPSSSSSSLQFASSSSTKTKTFCGTPRYISPEIIKGQLYDFSVDWWAFGVMLHEMLLQISPFADMSSDDDEIYRRVLKDDPMEKFPKSFSPEVRDLISRLFTKNPQDRIGCQIMEDCSDAISNHDFFKFNGKHEWHSILTKQFKVPYLPTYPSTSKYHNDHHHHNSDNDKEDKVDNNNSIDENEDEDLLLTPILRRELARIPQDEFKNFTYSSESFDNLLNVIGGS